MAKEKAEKPTHTVLTEFRDLTNFDQVYEVGDDVSHLSPARLATLVENGHVDKLAE